MKIRILVVDDEVKILKSLIFDDISDRAIFYFAEDEKKCVNILQSSVEIDWILMDGNLKDGVKGKDIVARLRSSGCKIPICMFSSLDESNNEGIDAGANTSIRKSDVVPLNPEKLIEHLENFLKGELLWKH